MDGVTQARPGDRDQRQPGWEVELTIAGHTIRRRTLRRRHLLGLRALGLA
jgi:hypothetical protein